MTTSGGGRESVSVRKVTDDHFHRLRKQMEAEDAEHRKRMEILRGTLEASRLRRQQQLKDHSEKFALAVPESKSKNVADEKLTHENSSSRTLKRATQDRFDLNGRAKNVSVTRAVGEKLEKFSAMQPHGGSLRGNTSNKPGLTSTSGTAHSDIAYGHTTSEALQADSKVNRNSKVNRSTNVPDEPNFYPSGVDGKGGGDEVEPHSVQPKQVSSKITKSDRQDSEGKGQTIFDTIGSDGDKLMYKKLEAEATQFLKKIDDDVRGKPTRRNHMQL